MADDAEDGAEDERLTELFAIQAIYPELSLDESDPYSARIDIPVELLQPLLVRFSNPVDGGPVPALTESLSTVSVNTDGPAANKPQGVAMEPTTFVPVIHHLSHLPPVTLILTLPKGYPSEHPPELSVQSSWLSSALTDQLEKSGQGIWEDGGHEQMVFAYLDSVREQAETAFGLVLGDRAALELSAELQVSLLDYDLKAKKRKFEQETFECGICLGMIPRPGTL